MCYYCRHLIVCSRKKNNKKNEQIYHRQTSIRCLSCNPFGIFRFFFKIIKFSFFLSKTPKNIFFHPVLVQTCESRTDFMSKNGTEAVFVLFLSCAKLFEHVKVFFQICVCVFSRDKDLQNVSSRLMKKITTNSIKNKIVFVLDVKLCAERR